MFFISFIFKPGTYDGEFHRLDAATEAVAKSTERRGRQGASTTLRLPDGPRLGLGPAPARD